MYLSTQDIQFSRVEALGQFHQWSQACFEAWDSLTQACLESSRHLVNVAGEKEPAWLAGPLSLPFSLSHLFQAQCLSLAHGQQACLRAWDGQIKLADSLALKILARASLTMPPEGSGALQLSRDWVNGTEQLAHQVTEKAVAVVEQVEALIDQQVLPVVADAPVKARTPRAAHATRGTAD